MASNFFSKLPFGWKKDHAHPQEPSDSATEAPLPAPSSYRARRSISEARPVLEQRMSMSLINKGLLNPTGENNCFLNSAVQVSLDIATFSLLSLSHHPSHFPFPVNLIIGC